MRTAAVNMVNFRKYNYNLLIVSIKSKLNASQLKSCLPGRVDENFRLFVSPEAADMRTAINWHWPLRASKGNGEIGDKKLLMTSNINANTIYS